MGWFSKDKQRTQESGGNYDDVPQLPRLPDMPNIPSDSYNEPYEMTQLPTIPSNRMGNERRSM